MSSVFLALRPFTLICVINRPNVNQIDPNGLVVQRVWWLTNLGKGLFHQGFTTDFHIERFAEGFSYIFRDVGFRAFMHVSIEH